MILDLMRYCPPRQKPKDRRLFFSPLQPVPRTAILMPGYHASEGTRVFPDGWKQETAGWHPEALAAPVNLLRGLAERLELGQVSMPPLARAVFTFTGQDHGFLGETDRDLFWRVFQVPIFEQLLAETGELVAYECEAHDGLHLIEGMDASAACLFLFGATVVQETCGCGLSGTRLLTFQFQNGQKEKSLAAAAG